MKVHNFVQENLITELSSESIHNMQKLVQTYVRSATTNVSTKEEMLI